MGEAGQVLGGMPDYGGDSLRGHSLVSQYWVWNTSILLANLTQMGSHFRMAAGKRGQTGQEVRGCLSS